MKYILTILLSLLLFSCGNKSRQVSTPVLPEAPIEESYLQPDTIVTEEEEELQEEVKKPTTPTSSSSSRSQKSSSYDRSATKGDACQSKKAEGAVRHVRIFPLYAINVFHKLSER